MWTSMQSCVVTSPLLLPVSSASQIQACVKHSRPNIVGMRPLPYNIKKGQLQTAAFQSSSPRFKCDAAMNVTCAAAGATQTVTRDARTITVTADKVKKIHRLDDNGPGLPPRDDDGNGGNGGGGGGNFSGGLVLLGILGVLDILKDIESEIQRKVKDSRFDRA